ncbi:hypothetical protein HHK36_028492 [Tetracentron sinense]|uniref:BHLH domain-containing protein n=1 Tax=Tetracentron sinense TaxID=13715 RepID=A0A834YHE2_TETSI|nr:hypothetical protein HHK36_028492 [Tetracentron sinense]
MGAKHTVGNETAARTDIAPFSEEASVGQVLAILMLSDFIPGRRTSVLEEAFNRNLLGSFLLANVLTGLINMYVDTIFASSITALVILVAYAFVLSVLTGFADFSGIKIGRMALEALSSNDLSSFICDTISASTPQYCHGSSESSFLFENNGYQLIGDHPHFDCLTPFDLGGNLNSSSPTMPPQPSFVASEANSATQGRKKRRRRPRICKNKEAAETQRMTHIAVERNRRKQMNEHLTVLRSLMPDSYIQRGDQASIVGGAIECVKELEQLLQSLEAKKRLLQQQQGGSGPHDNTTTIFPPPLAQFFAYPQYSLYQNPNEYKSKNTPAIADIEVTLIETHANLRILSRRRPRQLLKMVAGFQTLHLSILHLNVTTFDPLVEEGCHLTSVEDIEGAVHHMLRVIEEEAALA